MKKIGFVISIAFFANLFGQTDSTSIYFNALIQYNRVLDSENSNDEEIIIEATDEITTKLPMYVGTRTVTILTSSNSRKIYKKHNNKITHVKIFAARIEDDLLVVNITPYSGEYFGSRKGYALSIGNWLTVQFKFDCTENKFKYYNTKTAGI
jgi:hypothetical protein